MCCHTGTPEFLGLFCRSHLRVLQRSISRGDALLFGLRGGYVFSSRDDFGGGECADPQDRSRPCSRAVFQATATAIAAHLVRVALVAEWVPPFRDDERALWSVRPEIGVQYFWD